MSEKYYLLVCVFAIFSRLEAFQNDVLITGALQGLGKALAEEYAKQDWSVWAGTRTSNKLQNPELPIKPIYLDICSCGHSLDRDLNASINLLNEGASSLGLNDVRQSSDFAVVV